MDQIIDEIEISTTRKWFSKFITPQIRKKFSVLELEFGDLQ